MSSYILIIALSLYRPAGESFQISEFSSKESCEIALQQAKKFWRTVNDDSRCISVADEVKREKLEKEINDLKRQMP